MIKYTKEELHRLLSALHSHLCSAPENEPLARLIQELQFKEDTTPELSSIELYTITQHDLKKSKL